MINILRKSAYKHGYLILTAAWLYTLSFIIINYWTFTSSPASVQTKFEDYLKTSEQRFDQLSQPTPALRSLFNDTARPDPKFLLTKEELSFYVYERIQGTLFLNFWNTHIQVPLAADLARRDGKYFVKYPNGEFEFIKKTLFTGGKVIVVAGMIPIRYNYFFTNKYLRNEFAYFHELEERYDIDSTNQGIAIRNGDGHRLFSLVELPKGKATFSEYDSIPLVIRLVAIIFLLIFINFLAHDVVRYHGWLNGFCFLIAVILLLRTPTYFFAFPFDFRQLELFDELIYASSWLHPSLGDLLVNIILIFWIVTFLKTVCITPINEMPAIKGKAGWIVSVGLCMVLLVMSFSAAHVIRSMIADSKISFDVSNFFALTIYTLLSFIILCFIILGFFYLSHIVLLLIKKCVEVPAWVKYCFTAVLALIYLTMYFNDRFVSENLSVLAWLLIYLLLFEFRTNDLEKPLISSTFFLPWLIFFAASVSTLIIFQNRNLEWTQRDRIAEKLADESDPSGENLMSVMVSTFKNAFLTGNFSRFNNEYSNKAIKDSLINENFSGYLNKYDTRIYTFDAQESPLFNDDPTSYEVLSNIIINQSKKTAIENLYYYENAALGYSYLFEQKIRDVDGNVQGYFFVIAKPKRYQSESLYPELFKQVKDISADIFVNYAYGIYDKGELKTSSGDYSFKGRLNKNEIPRQESLKIYNGENSELWRKFSNNKLVIVVRKGRIVYDFITLFGYLFGSFLFIIVFFHLGAFLFRSRFRWRSIKTAFRFSIRSQIQLTIVFISTFSFVVIGVATIQFYIDRFKKTNNERLFRAITLISATLESEIASKTLYNNSSLLDETGESSLVNTITNISEVHSVDVNFYAVNGILRISTQPYVYSKRLLSEMMEPNAYQKLHYEKVFRLIQDENVGRFKYVSIYLPIKGHNGETAAYLNIPYLNSQRELNQEISNFLITLINLNALIFVLASAIALMLTTRITRSFSLIGSKMKDINLGKYNEEISWGANDEIGALVLEYNKMVKKLEESAQALAKSEREGAWREMARQVAHEIKNPLTPMKLSIQYLQRSIADNKPDVQVLAQRVSVTLVEQIDQLAKIASDFSQFANIGNVRQEKFLLEDVIASLVNLHSANERVSINWEKAMQSPWINADRLQVNRLFTNLVQNAIEASQAHDEVSIIIREEVLNGLIIISIRDHGEGIPEEMHDRIFTPNFTTKTSGTGLGLAICKGIVEKANGRISFVTCKDYGTVFYVVLPLAG